MNTSRALTLFLALALLGFVFFALSTPTARANPGILRVTANGTSDNLSCGDAWDHSCGLQYALTIVAVPGDELWVAAGTYTPTTTDVDPRVATFQLRNDVALYGGFAGTETSRSQRNFTANVTILSGDLNGNDNGIVTYDEATRAENAYHVVTGSGVTKTAVLDGFTVTGGNAGVIDQFAPDSRGGGIYNDGGGPRFNNITLTNNSVYSYGGGMANSNSSPILDNVTFCGNNADGYGGGMSNDTSSPVLTSVTFSANSAWIGGGMSNANSNPTLSNVTFISNTVTQYGGGMYNWLNSSPTLTNVTFFSNTVTYSNGYGGGMFNDTSSPVLTNVTFSGNSADIGGGMRDRYSNSTLNNVTFISNTATSAFGGMVSGGGSATLTNVTFSGNSASYGGGMGSESSSTTLTNVTFSANTATYTGGGMENMAGSPTLTNVTFSGNSAGQDGGGMYNRTRSDGTGSHPTIRNAIFWGNTASSDSQIGNDDTSTASLSDSVVQGGYVGGTHIVTADPLLGALGNYGGATQTIRLLPGSSAIDAGNNAICPSTDQRGKPRVGVCDSGAFEFQGYTLSKTNGDQQSTRVNTPFANLLQLSLTEIESGLLVPGMLVTFTAPSSGASAAWGGSLVVTATTNASGAATVAPPTANGIAGSYAVTASAAGLSPSATFALTNVKSDSTIVVTSSVNPSVSGQSVAFTAVVSGASPSGSVAFKDGGAILAGCGNVALSGGHAQCTVSSLAPGSHAITAAYSGDGNNNASTSAVYTQNVGALYDYLPLLRK